MKNKYLITLTLTLAGVLFLVGNLPAQKLTSGGKPKRANLENFAETYCVNLPNGFRVCKCRETSTVDWKPQFLIQKNKKTLISTDANLSAGSTTQDFYAYQGDLDKDGKSEIVIADLRGSTNGVGISTYDVHIFHETAKLKFKDTLTFPIQEFGETGNFIFDKSRNETLILLTNWNWYETLDRRRGSGFYLVGKWFRYRKNLLQPVLDKPTLARRYLNSFADERGKTYENSNAPYMWLKSKHTHKFFAEPGRDEKLIGTKFGEVKKFDGSKFTIQTTFNEILEYGLGCCPGTFHETQEITIEEFGILPQRFIFPNHFFDGFSPLMTFKKLEGKKVKLEIYQTKYLRYAQLWFVQK